MSFMSKDMQEMIASPTWPLSYDKWPNELNTNCIAYALGLPIDDPNIEIFNGILSDTPIEKLENLFNHLGLNHRRVSSQAEIKENEYGIVLYHYFYDEAMNCFGCKWTEKREETHLVRIELDGTWTHKFGWGYYPSITTPEEIHDTILHNDQVEVTPTAFFAIRKPQ